MHACAVFVFVFVCVCVYICVCVCVCVCVCRTQVQQDLPCPELEAGTPAGDTFIIHGQLSPHPALRENYDNTCVCHGWVAATSPDNRSHIRGHSSSGGADSEGGGCFDVATGRLFAIAMAAISGSNAVTMLPVIVIVPILAGLRSAPEAS